MEKDKKEYQTWQLVITCLPINDVVRTSFSNWEDGVDSDSKNLEWDWIET